MRAVAHCGAVCVFGLADSPPLALVNGAWTTLPPLPDTPGYDGPNYNPSGDTEPKVASVPLEFFADEAPASDDDASESSYDGPCQPTGETSSDDSEEGDSTDSDGDDEDDEDGAAL